ncbi:MAG: hypothetical protein RL385_1666 [Pseudomonadota bacterium]|jgi:hypothetical protein
MTALLFVCAALDACSEDAKPYDIEPFAPEDFSFNDAAADASVTKNDASAITGSGFTPTTGFSSDSDAAAESDASDAVPTEDGGDTQMDAATSDGGGTDAWRRDAGMDAGGSDGSVSDAGRTDGGAGDAGRLDAGSPDAGTTDAATGDASTPGGKCDPSQDYEPNNTAAQACALKLGEEVQSQTSGQDTDDYFSFPVEQGHFYAIAGEILQPCSAGLGVEITVGEGSPRTLLGPSTRALGAYAEDFAAEISGTARLHLSRACRYHLSVLPSTDDNLAHDQVTGEPNDTARTAAPLSLDQTVVHQPTSADGADFFRVPLERGKQYVVNVVPTGRCTSPVNVRMDLGNTGEIQSLIGATNFQGGEQNLTARAPASNGYGLVKVDTACAYELTVQAAP